LPCLVQLPTFSGQAKEGGTNGGRRPVGGVVQAGWLALCVALLGACGQGSPAREPADASTVPVVVTVTPSSVSLSPGASVQFTASVPVTWSIPAGIAGSIDPSGRYTAPLAPGSYRVVATSVDDPRTSVTAAVAVISSGPIEVSIDPPAATIDSGGTVPFTATVTGGQDGAVVWSADAGTVDQTGLFTAPLTGGTVRVTAVSRADPSASATAVVSVRSATVHLGPLQVTLPRGGTQQFNGFVTGAAETRVSWSVMEGAAGGSIDPSGNYTAPATPGLFYVVATSIADPRSAATAVVVVKDPPGVSVTIVPATVTVPPGGATRLKATVAGATDGRVVWTCDSGSIRTDGLYTAPHTEGTYHATAQSLADPSKVAVATLQVVRSPDTASLVEPPIVTVEVGGLVVFKAHLPGTADADVVWSIQEGQQGGNIDSLGQYIAPGDHEGVYHVVATGRTDPTKTGTATVTVQRYDLIDHGGSVAAATRTFALWWGDSSAFPPDGRTVIESFLGGLAGSDYLGVVDEYMRGSTATTSFGGSLFDSSAPPAENPTESAIADKACSALAANGITNAPGDLVFVLSSVFPAGTIPFCAWHYWGICNGQPLLVAYLPNPAGTACGRMTNGCSAFSGGATAMGTLAAHELMESVTDPFVSAWRDDLGEEIADKCAGLTACVSLSTATLQLQPLYSNALHSCVQR